MREFQLPTLLFPFPKFHTTGAKLRFVSYIRTHNAAAVKSFDFCCFVVVGATTTATTVSIFQFAESFSHSDRSNTFSHQ
ncbi:hypothetical protein EX30DRAFT_100951 [Ascodesmis nigricans]|uniref:Uncharacterized protein n=1 Tax=Ascodesmis nigricans TaxID=341454 RepID=A0A4S2N4R8_9PEZI|nr:hypothetical protein EX30DRAFT_100951 [Ascodesmis nigricans]